MRITFRKTNFSSIQLLKKKTSQLSVAVKRLQLRYTPRTARTHWERTQWTHMLSNKKAAPSQSAWCYNYICDLNQHESLSIASGLLPESLRANLTMFKLGSLASAAVRCSAQSANVAQNDGYLHKSNCEAIASAFVAGATVFRKEMIFFFFKRIEKCCCSGGVPGANYYHQREGERRE